MKKKKKEKELSPCIFFLVIREFNIFVEFLCSDIGFVDLYCLYQSYGASKSQLVSVFQMSACVNSLFMVFEYYRALKTYLVGKAKEE